MSRRSYSLLLVPLLAIAGVMPVLGGSVITYGGTSLGVNDQGHLNYTGLGPGGFSTYGVYRAGVGDAISPGCLCEGWGVAVTTAEGRTSGWASIDNGGIGGLNPTGTFGSTSTTATSEVSLAGAPLTVNHAYGPSLAPDVFQGQVTITNTGTETLTDLVYRRSMDWDVPPTVFSEFVTHQGVGNNLLANGGNILYASDNGFASSDPLSDASYIMDGTVNTDFVDSGVSDHGSVFDFAFGDLAPGASRVFNIFYGSRESEASAFAALSQLGIASGMGVPLPGGLYSLGQNSLPGGETLGTPATFIFAFGGVGGVEPGSTPENPILPFVPAEGTYEFVNPLPRRWYDPPYASAWTISIDMGSEFLEVGAPPVSFGYGAMDLIVGGSTIASLLPGSSYAFGPGVSEFTLAGISPPHDIANTTGFPLFLDFSTVPGSTITWTATLVDQTVPEPGSILLIASGILAVALPQLRRRLFR